MGGYLEKMPLCNFYLLYAIYVAALFEKLKTATYLLLAKLVYLENPIFCWVRCLTF